MSETLLSQMISADNRRDLGIAADRREYGGRRHQEPLQQMRPLKERPAQPLPAPSDPRSRV